MYNVYYTANIYVHGGGLMYRNETPHWQVGIINIAEMTLNCGFLSNRIWQCQVAATRLLKLKFPPLNSVILPERMCEFRFGFQGQPFTLGKLQAPCRLKVNCHSKKVLEGIRRLISLFWYGLWNDMYVERRVR
jgi:hypothetical protein